MKNYLKLISYLLLVFFIYSCNQQEKTPLPEEKESIPATISRQQLLFTIPWVDASVLPSPAGC